MIINFFSGISGHYQVLDNFAIFLADYLQYFLVAILLGFCLLKKNWTMFGLAMISGALARFVIKLPIVILYGRPRPFVSLDIKPLISVPAWEYFQSFPSGHALLFFAVSAMIYSYHKKLGIFFLICSGLMGIARIYCGVHYPSDIIVGATLGVLTALVVKLLFSRLGGSPKLITPKKYPKARKY